MNSFTKVRTLMMLRPSPVRVPWLLAALLTIYMGQFLATASAQEIQDRYGRRRGSGYGESVNGTSALIEMFQVKGHKVSTWGKLSPRINEFETIVWIPDSFDVPEQDAIDRLDDWLSDGYNKTLIYVGRDYDAEITYWQKMLPNASAAEKGTVERRLATAQARHASRKSRAQTKQECDWFESDATNPPGQINALQGEWAKGIDARKVDIWIDTTIEPNQGTQSYFDQLTSRPLLSSGSDAIVTEFTNSNKWKSNKLIVVNNGSFLLNVPLVNHENRKLAGKLIDSCYPGSDTLFLESDEAGITVQGREEVDTTVRPNDWMHVWPLDFIIVHLLAVGILFLFTYFPTFGRVKEIKEESTSDFGKHIESLGELVRKTGDQQYAISRIEYYQKHVKRDSGSKHTR